MKNSPRCLLHNEWMKEESFINSAEYSCHSCLLFYNICMSMRFLLSLEYSEQLSNCCSLGFYKETRMLHTVQQIREWCVITPRFGYNRHSIQNIMKYNETFKSLFSYIPSVFLLCDILVFWCWMWNTTTIY